MTFVYWKHKVYLVSSETDENIEPKSVGKFLRDILRSFVFGEIDFSKSRCSD